MRHRGGALDRSNPSGATISLAITPPTSPGHAAPHRHAVLQSGKGLATAQRASTRAEILFTPTLIDRFDLVRDGPAWHREQLTGPLHAAIDHSGDHAVPQDPTRSNSCSRQNREVSLECLDKAGDLVRRAWIRLASPAITGTTTGAGREQDQLAWHFLRHSGSRETVCQLYQTHTRAMVLDAPPGHSLPEVHQVAGGDRGRGLVQPVRLVPYQETCALRGETYGQSSIGWFSRQIKSDSS